MASVLLNAVEFLQSSKLADFTVKCGDFEWKVHHIILASGSKFFEKACGGTFKEAADKLIALHDDEAEMVARMLICLYTSDYPTRFHERRTSAIYPHLQCFLAKGSPGINFRHFEYETNPLMVHSKMYAIAEKYDMAGLQVVCVAKFHIDGHPGQTNLKNLVEALPHVYTSTPSSQSALRLKAAALVREFYYEIMQTANLKKKLEAACIENGQLGWDVLSNVFSRRHLRCAKCD